MKIQRKQKLLEVNNELRGQTVYVDKFQSPILTGWIFF